MKKIFNNLFLFLLVFSMYHCQPAEKDSKNLPNIILCMADDQGWGDMAYYGHPVIKTPNFDTMVAEGLRFDHFYAAAPVCSPTRGSVLTGRNPNRFGCFSWGRILRPQEITIAEKLKEAGYITGHFGKWHLGSVQQGSPVNPGNSGFDEWFSAPNFFDNDPILSREGIAVQAEGESSMVTVDAALDFIRSHEGGEKPYFAVVWFGSPHVPHRAINEDLEIYSDQPEKLQHFYGEITGMDRAFGKLRAELKSLETYENTILWYCSDNGGLPEIGATGGRGHKSDVYEGGLRVPAILEWPAVVTEPGIIEFPANTSDIFPTLTEIAGLQVEPNRPLDGESLVSVLEGKVSRREQPMGFWYRLGPGMGISSVKWMAELLEAQKNGDMIGDSSRLRLDDIKITEQYSSDSLPGHSAWLDWPWKLHRISHNSVDVKWELYQLDSDSMETEDLIATEVERASKMKTDLEAWQKSVIHSLNGGDY